MPLRKTQKNTLQNIIYTNDYGINCIAVIIALTIVHRYFICPILYWIGFILDDFNCSAMLDDKWWFSSFHSKTVKDFISYRKD